MSRNKLVALVLAATFAAGLTSGAPSASAWTSNGSSQFIATAGGSKFQISTTPIVGATCSLTSIVGWAYGPGPYSFVHVAADLSPAFSGCTVAGLAATVACTGNGIEMYVTGFTVGGVTPIATQRAAFPVCTISVTSLPGCSITLDGTLQNLFTGSWNNATSGLTVSSTGQSIQASWTAACAMFTTRPGTASAIFGSNGTPPGNLVYTVVTSYKPVYTA